MQLSAHRNAATSAPRDDSFAIEHVKGRGARAELYFSGNLRFRDAHVLWTELRRHAANPARGEALDFDMSGVSSVDGSAMALLVHLRAELQQRGVGCEFVEAPERVQQLVHLYRGDGVVGRRKRRRPRGTLDQIGEAVVRLVRDVQIVMAFIGQLVLATLGVFRAPRTANWRELPSTMERTGADALPIILLINFLLGLVMALQSSVQLKQFGATLFVADLIGIATCREIGPLMTAIIVCGRSGAAFAAELGSMRVNEEIDALQTMGIGPMRFLVLPRVLALMFVMPLLTLVADVTGMLGGLAVAVSSLDITPLAYLHETQKAVRTWDVLSGLIKSVVFGLTIALIACQQGLATTGGAEDVGRRTTSAVVTNLFLLVLIDAAFTLLFHGLRV